MKYIAGLIIMLVLIVGFTKYTGVNARPRDYSRAALPAVFQHFSDEVNISIEERYVLLETRGLPDHFSPYWGRKSESYEAPHRGMVVNPERIREQDLTLYIPLEPQRAKRIQPTRLGPIGIAVNGVPLFNQYAGPGRPLDEEIASFDRYNGHPQEFGAYHYHVEPLYITQKDSGLVGFLLDGFPIYGRIDKNGTFPTDLDTANGHFCPTTDYPDGIYHYHITPTEPYISGGYRGEPGYVTH